MIGKIMQNHSFRATSRYVLEKEKAELIGGNLFGETLDAMVDELAMTKALNPEIARPVYHLTQSYTAADQATGKLSPTRLAQLATRHFAGMVVSASEPALLEDTAAFQKRVRQFLQAEIHTHSFLIAVHQDRQHLHTHLVASRINLRDGKCIPTWYEQVRSKQVCRLLEQQFGLEPVANTRAALDEPTRERLVQTAAVLAQLEKTGTSLEATDYRLTRQGATLTLRRRHDDSIALKAYQDKQKRWRARGGDLTQEECVWWEAMNQAPAASTGFEVLTESEPEPAVAVDPGSETTQPTDPLELPQGIQPAIEPEPAALEPEPVALKPAAVAPAALEPAAIEPAAIEPAAVAPALEKTEPNAEKMDQLHLQKLPSLVEDIWHYYQERYPKGFKLGDYRFAPGESNSPPTLFKHGTKQLEWVPTKKRYQVEGLTLADYEAIQRHAEKVRIKSIKTVAPLMAKFLEQKGVKRWEDTDSTYGLSREGDLLTYYKQQERTIVYQAKLKEERWIPIRGRIPPEVKKIWLAWQPQEKEPPVKPPVKSPVKDNNGR